MREATGNALLTMMVTSIITIIMIFFVGSISYSKSYRIKNYIINQIEENRGWNDTLENDINSYMKEVGYNVRRKKGCPNDNKCGNAINNTDQGSYEYCIYSCPSGKYYKVLTYMQFEFPVIGNSLKFEVKGETKSFNDFN